MRQTPCPGWFAGSLCPRWFDGAPGLRCVLRAGALVVGCVATGLAFSSDAFSISAQTLKEVFGYTQTDVEVIMSMAMLGLVSAWPAGLLLPLLGPRWLSAAALFLTTGGCSFVCLAIHLHKAFANKAVLVAFFFLAIGAGNGVMYIAATSVNMRNFRGRWLGLVSGLLHSVKSILLGILLGTFHGLSLQLEAPALLGGSSLTSSRVEVLLQYMTVLAAMYAVTNLLAVAIYADYYGPTPPETSSNKPWEKEEEGEILKNLRSAPANPDGEKDPILPVSNRSSLTYNSTAGSDLTPKEGASRDTGTANDNNSNSCCYCFCCCCNTNTDTNTSRDCLTLTLLKDPYYHSLFWPCVLILGFRNSFLNNLSILMVAERLSSDTAIYILIPIVGTVSKPLIGAIADYFDQRIPRALPILASSVALAVLCLLDIGWISSIHLICGTMFVAQIASSCVQTLGPPILVERFGDDAFSAGWGLVTVGFTLATTFLQIVVGAFYDHMAPSDGAACHGASCFRLYFWVNLVFMAFSCATLLFLLIRQRTELLRATGTTTAGAATGNSFAAAADATSDGLIKPSNNEKLLRQ